MPIQFPNNYFEDERWLEAGPEAFTVFVLACEYSDRRDLDGLVPRAMLSRVCLPVSEDKIEDSIRTLVDLGFFAPAGRGNSIRIVRFLEDKIGFLASDKEETRTRWAENKRRYRKHVNGNHELCDPAKCASARKMSSVDSTEDGTVDGLVDSSGESAKESGSESRRTIHNASRRNATLRSSGALKDRSVKGSSDSKTPPEPSGSAGAPPAGPESLEDALVFEGTQVQVATLLPADVDPRLPQLRVETADGDADAVFVALPNDDLESAAAFGFAEAVRAANADAAEAMRGWGSVAQDEAGHTWLVCQADYETQVAYVKAFVGALQERGVEL